VRCKGVFHRIPALMGTRPKSAAGVRKKQGQDQSDPLIAIAAAIDAALGIATFKARSSSPRFPPTFPHPSYTPTSTQLSHIVSLTQHHFSQPISYIHQHDWT
jgi:hypothetical protein